MSTLAALATSQLHAQLMYSAFEEGAAWKYLDTAKAPAEEWIETDFDDSGWKEGNAPFGYGDKDIATTLDFGPDPKKKPLTVWLRKSFMVGEKKFPDSLILQFFRDDGAVIYLNGKELVRSNMPAGYIDAKTMAVSTVSDRSERKRREFLLGANDLKVGKNVIAVEVHQKGHASSDLAFDLMLEIGILGEDWSSSSNRTDGGDPATPPKEIDFADAAAVKSAGRADWELTRETRLKSAMAAYADGKLKEAVHAYYGARWSELFSSRGFGLDPGLKEFFVGGNQTMVSQEFFDLLGTFDAEAKVLEIMNTTFKRAEKSFRDYPKLALAIALVYDKKPPRAWPHYQVSEDILPRRLPDALAAMKFFVETDEGGKSLHSLKTLTIEELTYVVDTPVPFDELKEAQKVRVSLGDFGRLYSGIKYVHKRRLEGIANWPHDSYALPEIKEQGGICVDQAYYTCQMAKAHGVPSMIFSGAGSNGNHAWVGFLDRRGRWNFEVGRYPEAKFVTGETHDPQTWQQPTDHELALLSERFRNTSKYRVSRIHTLFAGEFLQQRDLDAAIKASLAATASEGRNAEAWEALIRAKKAAKATHAELEAIYLEAAKEFRSYADLEASFLRRLANSLDQQDKTEEADKLRSRIVSRNRRERPDLALEEAREMLKEAMKNSPPDDQLALYKRQVSSFKDAGLIAYYAITDPFLKHLKKKGHKDVARDALKYTQRRMDVKAKSQLENSLIEWEKKLED